MHRQRMSHDGRLKVNIVVVVAFYDQILRNSMFLAIKLLINLDPGFEG